MKIRDVCIGIVAGGVILTAGMKACAVKTARHTIEDRMVAIVAKKPKLKNVARSSGGKLRILVFKNERSVEVYASGWKEPRIYPMTAFSGTLGPKLREGDGLPPPALAGAPRAA